MPQQNTSTERATFARAQSWATAGITLSIVGIVAFLGYQSGWFSNQFNRSVDNLAPVINEVLMVPLNDGDTYDLEAGYVSKEVGNRTLRMAAYNQHIPGPFIKVAQGSTITLRFTNNLDIPMTVHSHGIRIAFPYDGTPDVSQKAVEPGETFEYVVHFKDAGVYWYHPHVREDYAQELGLSGNYLVEPRDYPLPPVNDEETLIIDDILIENGDVFPFFKDRTNFAIMGRFGNVMLTNGREDYTREVQVGDVLRLNITNVANARPFELTIAGAKMKLVASDLSPYEREEFIEKLLITPSERYVVDVYFPREGSYTLTHTSHDAALGPIGYTLATFHAKKRTEGISRARDFNTLHRAAWVERDAAPFSAYLYKKPDRTLRLTMDPGDVDFGAEMASMPCHRMPDGEWMGACTESKKEAWLKGLSTAESAMGGEKIHWEDHLFDLNSITTSRDIEWQIVDETTGKKNMEIDDWRYEVGDTMKLRIFNDPLSPHPMQHPFHMHGQRMMLLSINGEEVENKVWKDTILIPVGDTYDIMVEFSNPGIWMNHCHIAEHMHSGMMFNFAVGKEYYEKYAEIQAYLEGEHRKHGH